MSHLGINYLIKDVYIWIYPRKMVQKLNGLQGLLQELSYSQIKVALSGIFLGNS